jgi:hypothetical protein
MDWTSDNLHCGNLPYLLPHLTFPDQGDREYHFGCRRGLCGHCLNTGRSWHTYQIGRFEKDSRQNPAFGAGFRNSTAAPVAVFAGFSKIENDVLLMVLMVTIFAIIISILVGIILKKRLDAGKGAKGSGA